jgi:chaperonin GroES
MKDSLNYTSAAAVEFYNAGIADQVELLNGYILVEQWQGATKTDGGLFIPDSAVAKKNKYTVMAVAEDVTAVKVGDCVIIDRFAGNTQVIDDKTYFVAKVDDLILRFKNG